MSIVGKRFRTQLRHTRQLARGCPLEQQALARVIRLSGAKRKANVLQVRTYISASQVEGVGAFAAEPIRKGAIIWRPDPEFELAFPFSRYLEAPPYLRELLDRYAYPSMDRPGLLIYETDNGRFMNHSERPNTDFSNAGRGTALADILEGEELTCNYSQFFGTIEHGFLADRRPIFSEQSGLVSRTQS